MWIWALHVENITECAALALLILVSDASFPISILETSCFAFVFLMPFFFSIFCFQVILISSRHCLATSKVVLKFLA